VRERADHDQASPGQTTARSQKLGKKIPEGTVNFREQSILHPDNNNAIAVRGRKNGRESLIRQHQYNWNAIPNAVPVRVACVTGQTLQANGDARRDIPVNISAVEVGSCKAAGVTVYPEP
jgi:hypothetical protein